MHGCCAPLLTPMKTIEIALLGTVAVTALKSSVRAWSSCFSSETSSRAPDFTNVAPPSPTLEEIMCAVLAGAGGTAKSSHSPINVAFAESIHLFLPQNHRGPDFGLLKGPHNVFHITHRH